MTLTPTLRAIRDRVGELRRRWVEERLSLIEWLPHQAGLLRDTARVRLLRTGNQIGKTEAGVSEVIYAAIGEHPFREPTHAAGEYWVVCASWSQSRKIQNKLWDLAPRAAFAPGTTCTKRDGFGGRYPSVTIRHASGEWSHIEFKTTGQESIDVAGATIDGVLFDEPPRDRVLFDEIVQRTRALNGWILLTLTPIGAPTDWLRDMVNSGAVSEHHTRLVPEALIPEGRSRPLRLRDKRGRVHEWNAAWVAMVRKTTSGHDAAIRLDGEWETREKDAYFGEVWAESRVLIYEIASRPVVPRLGIDYGHRPGKQYACLLYAEFDIAPDELIAEAVRGNEEAWSELVSRTPRVTVADEYCDEAGMADPRRDAIGILSMLERNGWDWVDLVHAGGDRVHMPGTAQQKSNADLMLEVSDLLGVHYDALWPRVRTVKRGEGMLGGSVNLGLRFVFRAMALDRFHVHADCVRTLAAVPRFRLRNRDDEHKDVLDGIRYGLHDLIFSTSGRGATPDIVIG